MSLPRGVGLKLTRAHEHLLNLESEINYYLNSGAPRLGVEVQQHRDGSHWRLVAKWEAHGPPPERLSALIGDLVHNLRSALDHLACGFVTIHTGAPAPTGPGGTQFPILTKAPMNNKGDPQPFRVNGGVSETALAFVLGLQPYVRLPEFPEADDLAIIQALDNADKHHSLNLAACSLDSGTLKASLSDGQTVDVPLVTGPLDDVETVVGTYRVDGPYDARILEIDSKGTIGIVLKEPDSVAGELLRPLMQRLFDYVAGHVVTQAADHFKGSQPDSFQIRPA